MILGAKDILLTKGRLTIIHTEDGRTLVELWGAGHGPPYLELLPADMLWFLWALQNTDPQAVFQA
jgi:hypothetical protein